MFEEKLDLQNSEKIAKEKNEEIKKFDNELKRFNENEQKLFEFDINFEMSYRVDQNTSNYSKKRLFAYCDRVLMNQQSHLSFSSSLFHSPSYFSIPLSQNNFADHSPVFLYFEFKEN